MNGLFRPSELTLISASDKRVTSTCVAPLALVAALLLASCDVGVQTYRSSDESAPSVAAFVRFIAEGNAQGFVDDLNKVRRDDPNPPVLEFLQATWQESKMEAPPALLRQDLVLIELAATLAQASLNGVVGLDETEFHEVIRRGATSENLDVRERALFSLSMFDDPVDVQILAQAIESADDSIYRTAVVALARMCSPEADVALRSAYVPEARRAFLEQTRARYREDPAIDRVCASRSRGDRQA